jgi:hypothetical protein
MKTWEAFGRRGPEASPVYAMGGGVEVITYLNVKSPSRDIFRLDAVDHRTT